MKPLYTQLEFEKSKSQDKLSCECYYCKQVFYKEKKEIIYELKNKRGTIKYCSNKCYYDAKITKIKVHCLNCNIIFDKKNSFVKKMKKHFCSKSCSATYNNVHKTQGTRRSKLENYLEEQLTLFYPTLHISFNKKDAINSELDIYIPSLKLAFELNGVFHYEPIFGDEKLNQTQNNDQRKFQACAEQNISLCIIDVSKQKYFKESSSNEFLKIITTIIDGCIK